MAGKRILAKVRNELAQEKKGNTRQKMPAAVYDDYCDWHDAERVRPK